MSRGDKRWIIAGSLVALTGLGIFALQHRSHRRRLAADEEAAAARFRGLASGPLGPSGGSNGALVRSPEELKRDVAADMSRWRIAVVGKDAETVVALDLTFRQLPDLYTDALAKSAETEANERVRAFSTRVLGKLKRPDQEPLYERLLTDKSVYVRQNAAWALGELGAADPGRTAAEHAVSELRHVHARDPANEVRLAAKDALNKLE
jgi:HEAT repeat protein